MAPWPPWPPWPPCRPGPGLDHEALQRLDRDGSCSSDGAREAAAFPGEGVRFGGDREAPHALAAFGDRARAWLAHPLPSAPPAPMAPRSRANRPVFEGSVGLRGRASHREWHQWHPNRLSGATARGPAPTRLSWPFIRERVTRVELAFSAWEFDQARSADQGRYTNGQVRPVFLVPVRPPRSAEILSVVARMWHGEDERVP